MMRMQWLWPPLWVLLSVPACSENATEDDPTNDAGQDGSRTQDGGGAGHAATGGRTGGTGGIGNSGQSGKGGTAGTGGRNGTGGSTGGGGSASGGRSGSAGASTDAGTEGGPMPESGVPGEWTECPTAADYEGDASGPHDLEVTEEAVYCATFSEERTLKEELAAKLQLRLTPGTYALPGADHESLGLLACLRDADGIVASSTSGRLGYESSTFSGSDTHNYSTVQPIGATPLGGALRLSFSETVPTSQTPEFILDGTEVDIRTEGPSFAFRWCPSDDPSCFPQRVFDSCTHASSRLNRHSVTLADSSSTPIGSLVFELRIGESFASTEPGAFVRASGTFGGQDVDQTDYFKLIYNPEHHHFERHFAVLFDAPIDGACGVEVTHLEPFNGNATPDEAHAVDCALNHIETLKVTSHELTVE